MGNETGIDGCGKRLAPDQWWAYCGETDMGQTLPALCTECGGELRLMGPMGLAVVEKPNGQD